MPDDKAKPPAPPPAGPPEAESLDTEAPAPSVKPATPAPTADKKKTPKVGAILTLREKINIFLAIFVLLVLAAGSVVYVTVKSSKTDTTSTPLGKLTDKELSQLKGSTTLVGDTKQTLDIQSSTIFEGAVLVRSDLNVAGAIKVGNGINLPTVTVTGNGNFGQLGVSGNVSVGGDTNLQGQLTVSKNLNVGGTATFGNLSVGNLSVTTLQLKGDLSLSKHILTSGSTPGRTTGTAVGSGGTVSISGNDIAGSITINTGGSPPAGIFTTVNFVQKFASTPHVIITPVGSGAAGLQYYINRDSTGFSIGTANTPPASSNFGFDYVVIE